jgi:hypothetical protein
MKTHQRFRPSAAVLAVLAASCALRGAEPAAIVAGLRVTPVTLSRLDLHWDPVKDAERYNVYCGDSPGLVPCDANWIASTTDSFYSSRDLAPSTTYYYQVRAVVGGKESASSAQASGATRHKDLALAGDGARRIVEGDAFQIAWDTTRGGEIAEIAQYDGCQWVSILGAGDTIPRYAIRDRAGDNYRLREAAAADVRVVKETPDEIALRFEASPRTADGKTSPWRIAQTFRVFKEGVLFCDLEISAPEGAPPFEISRAELGMTLGQRLTAEKFRWGYFTRDSWRLMGMRSASDQVAEKCMFPYVAVDYGLGSKSSFTNHVAFFIEDWRALTGPKESSGCRFAPSGEGGMAYTWVLYDGSGRIRAPYAYRNRWGMALGAMRKSSRRLLSASRGNNLIGARYYHTGCGQGHPVDASPDDWPWYVQPKFWSQPAPSDVYPSNETIDEAAKSGANVFVLHQSWMRCGGSNNWPPADYTPQNPKELKRVVDRCHANNMRFGLYMRGTEAYALYMPYWEQFCKYDYDGMYVDWNGPFYYNMNTAHGCFRPSETHFHAYDYFRYTKMLRKRVGENGFLIAHTGACQTLLALAVFDCYLPGEFSEQKDHLLDSPDAHVYLGMGSCCGTTPISYTAPHEKAAAYSAGLGTWLQMERGLLWRIWESVPMDKARLYNNLTENLQVVSSANPDFHSCVYKIDRNRLLVVTANFGERGESTLRLDMPALGLTGQYAVTELGGKDAASFAQRSAGQTRDGVIEVAPLGQYEFRGYKLDRVAGGL